MLNIFKSKRRKKLEQSDYGREEGWIIEVDAVKIAALIKPIYEDMFWYSYELVLINTLFKCEIYEALFWERSDLFFFSKALNEYCYNKPIVNLMERERMEKVLIRGLYIES